MTIPILEVFLYLYPVSITAEIVESLIQGRAVNLFGTLVFLFFFAIFQASVFFTVNFVNEILAHRVTTDITYELFTSMQKKSLTYHDGKDIGQIMARATGDTRTLNMALSPGISRMLALATAWGLSFYIAASLNFYLVILTTIFLVLFLLSVIQFTKKRIEFSRQVLINFSNITEHVLRSVVGIREIKGYTVEQETKLEFDKLNQLHKVSVTKEGEKSAVFYPALIVTLYSTSIIVTSVFLAFVGQLTFAQVVLITGIILFLENMASNQQWQFRQIIASFAAVDRLYKMIFEEDRAQFISGHKELKDIHASIEFQNVSFRYQDGAWVFKNLSFSIDENQTIAIVGMPGSGKSTLTKLIQRLYLPSSGRILIGGTPIQEFDNTAFRRFIATVEQDIFLFNKSIFDNIRFGKTNASRKEVIEVANIAHAHDFIMNFSDGYDTIIGERGVRLSGGQAQRISIARALLVNPAILILDDGVSALDARTEIEIQRAISEILRTRTTVITTHRLSIISQADLIIMLGEGGLLGMGTHTEMIRSNIHYRQLFEFHYVLPPLELVK